MRCASASSARGRAIKVWAVCVWMQSWLRTTYGLCSSSCTTTTTTLPDHLAQHPERRGPGSLSLPPHRDNTDGQLGYVCYLLRGMADNDTAAQVVKCTPVIVLCRAEEIMLFKWHPACLQPAPLGPSPEARFVFLTSKTHPPKPPPTLHPPLVCPVPMMHFVTCGFWDGLTRPVSMTTSSERW